MIRLYDTYAVGVTVLAIVLLEVTAVSWCYGLRAMSNDIKAMLGFKPNYFWLVCWKFLSPAAIIVSTKLCWLSGKIGANQHNFFPLWTRTNRQNKLKLDHTSTKPDQPKPDQVRPNIMFEWITIQFSHDGDTTWLCCEIFQSYWCVFIGSKNFLISTK